MLYRLRIDPEKVDAVRDHFDSLDGRRDVFERGLDLKNMHTEAAWLHESDDGPVLYYYEEASDDYPPEDLDLADVDDPELLELDHLFFASTLDHDD